MGELYQARRFEQGFTLIELLIGIALAALVVAIGVPSFSEISERKKLEGAAEKLYSDLQFAKAESISRNVSMYVNFDIAHQCYGISWAASCSCSPSSTCLLDGVDKSVKMSDFGQTALSESFTGTELTFDPRRGTISPSDNTGWITFTSPRNKEVRIIIENGFRIRICSPAGANKDFTYADC